MENQAPQGDNTPPTRVRLAHEAAELITGHREADYGPPSVNLQRIADFWNIHMQTDIFTPRKVAELMILLKLARTIQSPTEDSYKDAIGYAALAGEMSELEAKALADKKLADVQITPIMPNSWRTSKGHDE